MAIGEQLSYTCLGNDNDTVVLIVTGAVEFVAFIFDDRGALANEESSSNI